MNLNYILENDLLRVSLWNLGLTGVAQAGGEAVDSEQDCAFDARVHFGVGAVALQEYDLRCRTVVSMEAATVSSTLSRARRGRPYLSATTSPCSVILMVPSTASHGCARIASAVGPAAAPDGAAVEEQLAVYRHLSVYCPYVRAHAIVAAAVHPPRRGRAATEERRGGSVRAVSAPSL